MTKEERRKVLTDDYGTAMSSGNPTAVIELSQAQNASEKELVRMADQLGGMKEHR